MASNHHNFTTPKSIPTVIIFFSYFIFFFPYLFKFFFFISPLFLTTSLLFILSIFTSTSNLGFLHSFLLKLPSKFNNNNHHAVDDENEYDYHYEFRDFELYNIVFRDPDDPPLITVDGDDLQDKYVVTEFEQQRKLNGLFDELDRFEGCSTTSFEINKMNEIEENVVKLQKLAPFSDEYQNSLKSECSRSSGSCGSIGDETTSFEKNENEMRSPIDNQNSVNSNSWRSESSRSFGSCGSIGDETTSFEVNDNETRSYVGKVIGELQKLEPVRISYSDEDQKTVRLNSTVAIELKMDSKTTSHVRKVVQRLEPVPIAVSISGDDQKSIRSKSTAAIERKNNETTSHVQKMLQILEPVPVAISISGEDQKIVRSKSTAEIDTKNSETTQIGTKNNQTTTYIQKVNGQQTTATQIKNLKPVKASNTPEEQDFVRSNTSTVIETKNSGTTSHIKKQLQKSISVEEQKPVQNTFTARSNSWRSDSSSSFGSYGSMRKEKEWKRTLACKLFEERNSSNGEEGMDSLWEAYEDDNNNNNNNKRSKNKKMMMMNKNKKKSELKYLDDVECEDDDEEEEDEDDDEFMSNGQVCCLKALKLSTGKMNLGMGKPNLVKISKVFKGFGWLHHVGSKHSKKY